MKLSLPLAVAVVAVVLGSVNDAGAVRIDGAPVLIPVATHADGLLGSVWRTDLFLDNPYSVDQEVTLTFHPTSGSPVSAVRTIPTFGGLELPDVVRETFGLDSATGMIVIDGPAGSTRIEARSRIFNVGSSVGEFGQFVPGFPVAMLSRQANVCGLSGTGGNRLNIGIANPNDEAVDVDAYAYSGSTYIGGRRIHVEALQLVRVNDLFTAWEMTPAGNVRITMSTSLPIYGYASVVRNDSGDAIFVFGTAPNTGP